MKANIDARYYRECSDFVSHEQSRYTLCAIRLEPHPEKGVLIVATDGHTMAIFHDEQGECSEPFNLFWREWVASVCLDGRVLFVNEDRSVSVIKAQKRRGEYSETPVARFLNLIADADDVRFPEWRMVLPEATEAPPITFNPLYLAHCALGNERNAPISIWAKDNTSQAVVKLWDRDDFVAIVMPVKSTEEYPKDLLAAAKKVK
jgi:DNA polymerase III sliding clamp (beta) subunit (PCNA family)